MFSQTVLLPLLAAATCVSSKLFARRDEVPHDSIDPFPETVSDDAIGETMKRFEPFLNVADGCQSYPAVDADGNTRSLTQTLCQHS